MVKDNSNPKTTKERIQIENEIATLERNSQEEEMTKLIIEWYEKCPHPEYYKVIRIGISNTDKVTCSYQCTVCNTITYEQKPYVGEVLSVSGEIKDLQPISDMAKELCQKKEREKELLKRKLANRDIKLRKLREQLEI